MCREISEKCLACPLCVDDDEALYCLANFMGMHGCKWVVHQGRVAGSGKFQAIVTQLAE